MNSKKLLSKIWLLFVIFGIALLPIVVIIYNTFHEPVQSTALYKNLIIKYRNEKIPVNRIVKKQYNEFNIHSGYRVYLIFRKDGNLVQKIYGDESWNHYEIYDIDSDNIPEFFFRQTSLVNNEKDVQDITCYKYSVNFGKYVFSKNYKRDTLPIYLEISFFSVAWFMIFLPFFIVIYGIVFLGLFIVTINKIFSCINRKE